MATDDMIIEAEGLGRRYRSLRALSDIDIKIGVGEIVGLVGPDGAGKTTLLQLFAAILDPSEGRCRVLGHDTVKQAARITSAIGYMAQGFTLYDRLTVAENLSFAAKIRGVPDNVYMARRRRLLDMAGLAPFLDRREGALSGGNAQEARALRQFDPRTAAAASRRTGARGRPALTPGTMADPR